MKQKTMGKLFPYLLILPSLIILAGVVFYPIAASLLRSFQLEAVSYTHLVRACMV